MKKKIAGIVGVALSCILNPALADQFEIANADEAQHLLWQKIYPSGGWTLYCGDHFTNDHRKLQMHAVYAMQWVIDHLDCGSINECRGKSARFNRIEADLHNIYPVLAMTGSARKDYQFGLVDGEFRDFFECDFEVDGGHKTVEPRASAKGNIARAIFYMIEEYQLPLASRELSQLLEWNRQDPVSEDEIRRNRLIETVQGNRNRFIDDPSRASRLINH